MAGRISRHSAIRQDMIRFVMRVTPFLGGRSWSPDTSIRWYYTISDRQCQDIRDYLFVPKCGDTMDVRPKGIETVTEFCQNRITTNHPAERTRSLMKVYATNLRYFPHLLDTKFHAVSAACQQHSRGCIRPEIARSEAPRARRSLTRLRRPAQRSFLCFLVSHH